MADGRAQVVNAPAPDADVSLSTDWDTALALASGELAAFLCGVSREIERQVGILVGRRGDIERLSNRLFLVIPPGSTVIRA